VRPERIPGTMVSRKISGMLLLLIALPIAMDAPVSVIECCRSIIEKEETVRDITILLFRDPFMIPISGFKMIRREAMPNKIPIGIPKLP